MSENCKTRSKASKVMALVLSFVLVICASVAGTLAWLTAQTGEVQNTFTSAELFADPGDQFTLWEHHAVAQDDGTYELDMNSEVYNNTYEILPGVNIPKDPTVDVVKLEEYAYLYIKVDGLPMPNGLAATIDSDNWDELNPTEYPGVYVYKGIYANDNIIEATEGAKVSFEANILTQDQDGMAITVSNDYNGTANGDELNFMAYMVQATGNGANAAEAWANTYGEPATP